MLVLILFLFITVGRSQSKVSFIRALYSIFLFKHMRVSDFLETQVTHFAQFTCWKNETKLSISLFVWCIRISDLEAQLAALKIQLGKVRVEENLRRRVKLD